MLNGVFLMFDQLMFPETGEFVRLDADFVVGLAVGDSREGDRGDGKSRGVVESEHGPRGGGRSFLDVAEYVELLSVSPINADIQKSERLTLDRPTFVRRENKRPLMSLG
jgi:hypothetical protein